MITTRFAPRTSAQFAACIPTERQQTTCHTTDEFPTQKNNSYYEYICPQMYDCNVCHKLSRYPTQTINPSVKCQLEIFGMDSVDRLVNGTKFQHLQPKIALLHLQSRISRGLIGTESGKSQPSNC
jgi:hypothetical protein